MHATGNDIHGVLYSQQHIRLYTSLYRSYFKGISAVLNCNCIAWRAVDRTRPIEKIEIILLSDLTQWSEYLFTTQEAMSSIPAHYKHFDTAVEQSRIYNIALKENSFKCCTYHLRFIPEGVAEASQIFLREAHVLSK
jgi:hypothetical protein